MDARVQPILDADWLLPRGLSEPVRSRRAKVKRSTGLFGPYAEP